MPTRQLGHVYRTRYFNILHGFLELHGVCSIAARSRTRSIKTIIFMGDASARDSHGTKHPHARARPFIASRYICMINNPPASYTAAQHRTSSAHRHFYDRAPCVVVVSEQQVYGKIIHLQRRAEAHPEQPVQPDDSNKIVYVIKLFG